MKNDKIPLFIMPGDTFTNSVGNKSEILDIINNTVKIKTKSGLYDYNFKQLYLNLKDGKYTNYNTKNRRSKNLSFLKKDIKAENLVKLSKVFDIKGLFEYNRFIITNKGTKILGYKNERSSNTHISPRYINYINRALEHNYPIKDDISSSNPCNEIAFGSTESYRMEILEVKKEYPLHYNQCFSKNKSRRKLLITI